MIFLIPLFVPLICCLCSSSGSSLALLLFGNKIPVVGTYVNYITTYTPEIIAAIISSCVLIFILIIVSIIGTVYIGGKTIDAVGSFGSSSMPYAGDTMSAVPMTQPIDYSQGF